MVRIKDANILEIDLNVGAQEFDAKKLKKTALNLKNFTSNKFSTDGTTLTISTASSPIKITNFTRLKYFRTNSSEDWIDIIASGIISYTGNYKVRKNTVTGTNYSDIMDFASEPGKLIINSGKGNDTIYGGAGINTINAGDGNDTIYGSLGTDTITGGKGVNVIKYTDISQLNGDKIKLTKGENLIIDISDLDGATATYKINGRNLDVTVTKGLEKSTFSLLNFGTKDILTNKTKKTPDTSSIELVTSEGTFNLKDEMVEFVKGNTGTWHNDYINRSDYFNAKNKGLTLNGGNGNDKIIGTNYNDTIRGGNDNDNIYGGKGDDKLYGDAGNNYIHFKVGDGKDTVFGGKGEDTLVFDDISVNDIRFERGATKKTINDLTIWYSENDCVTIKNYYVVNKKTKLPTTSVKNIITSEGLPFNIGNIKEGSGEFSGDENDNVLIGSDEVDKIYGVGGNNMIFGNGGNDSIYGGTGNDTISGGDGDDNIHGNKGNNKLYGDSGNDIIWGGSGDDYINGGDGDDKLYGYSGNNTFDGGNGNDIIHGSDDLDTINGGSGNDTIYGYAGVDIIYGNDGNDTIDGGGGNDTINGDAGDDIISGNAGNDIVNGDEGNDTITGGSGNDTLNGGAGNNTFIFNYGDGQDIIEFCSGSNDTVQLNTKSDLKFSRNAQNGDLVMKYGTGTDQITLKDYFYNYPEDYSVKTIKNGNETLSLSDTLKKYGITITGTNESDSLEGREGNDTINGNNGDDTIYGNGGNDKIYGGAGADYISGGDDDDYIEGGAGNDSIEGNDGNDTIRGGAGDDWLVGESGNDTLDGGDGNDYIYGGFMYEYSIDSGNNTINGGAGNDSLIGNLGNDTIHGGEGVDEIYGIGGTNFLYGDEGNDYIEGGVGDDTIEGGAGNDNIYGGEGNDTIDGGTGNDYISGGNDNDIINGDDGNDEIWGDAGNDILNGNAGDDKIYGGDGIDTINGGNGNDEIYGGNGDDTINGDDGDDDLNGDAGNDTINGGNGNDEIWGNDGNDIITGGKGNDHLYGNAGNNKFIFNNGDGQDIIEYNNGSEDTVQLNTKSDLKFIKNYENNDLIMKYGTGDDQITFIDYQNYSSNYSVKTIKNGTETLSLKDAINKYGMTINGDDGNNTLNGTEGNDFIYGNGGKDFLYGKDGNDTLYGGEENDCIYGENGNDVIYGGAGNDTIFGGAGTNYIHIKKNEGSDTIQKGDGEDILVFDDETSLDDLDASISGLNLIIKTNNGNTVTLFDGKTSHSVKYVQFGTNPTKYNVSDIKHHIVSTNSNTTGTDMNDDIKVNYNGFAIVHAGNGDDILHITNPNNSYALYGDNGNDTYSIDCNKVTNSYIYSNKNQGNDTLKGITNITDFANSKIHLGDWAVNQLKIIPDDERFVYTKGTKSGNDLILYLTSGETFTIKDYYSLTGAQRNTLLRMTYRDIDTQYIITKPIESIVHLTGDDGDLIEVPQNENSYDVNDNNKLVVAERDTNSARSLTISGDNNNVIQMGQNTQYTNIEGSNNTVYVVNTGDDTVNANYNDLYITGGNNTIKVSGGNRTNLTMDDNLDDNAVFVFSGKKNFISTSQDGKTYLNVNGTDENSKNIINSYGKDLIFIDGSKNDVYLGDTSETREIYISEDAVEANIYDLANANGDVETYIKVSNFDPGDDIMFSHYYNSSANSTTDGEDYITFVTDTSDIKETNTRFYGNWESGVFDLDTDEVNNRAQIIARGDVDAYRRLNEMTQYVNMASISNNVNLSKSGGILDHSAGVYVQGTNSNDNYVVSDISTLTKQCTINEIGGADTITVTGNNKFRLFFDVDTAGNFKNDLYIFETKGIDGGDYGSEFERFIRQGIFKEDEGAAYREANYICIKNNNALSSANVEHIISGTKEVGVNGYISAIKESVANWLNTYNTDNGTSYGSVMEAIQDGAGNMSLFNTYTANAQTAWNNNLYDLT